MVVADYEVDAMLAGMGYLLVGLDAAVEDDDEFYALTGEIVDDVARDSIPFFVAGGNEIVDVGVEVAEILVDQRNGCSAIDVVVAVDHYLLFRPHGSVEPVHRFLHVGHKEGVVEIFQPGIKESLGILDRRDATLHQQLAYGRA